LLVQNKSKKSTNVTSLLKLNSKIILKLIRVFKLCFYKVFCFELNFIPNIGNNKLTLTITLL